MSYLIKERDTSSRNKMKEQYITIFKYLYRQARHTALNLVHTAKFKCYTEIKALLTSSKEQQIVDTV